MNTQVKQFTNSDEYNGYQIKVIQDSHTFARVLINDKDGKFIEEFNSKAGDAMREAQKRVQVLH